MYTKEEQQQLNEASRDFISSNLIENIDLLRKVIIYHEWRYSVLNDPTISDYEYDQLFKKLQNIEKQFPELVSGDSPTQRISKDITEDSTINPHIVPMLSLENSYNEDDLDDFDKQVRKWCDIDVAKISYSIEPKFDGGSIALVYENDALVRASTRGNGMVGEEITANIKTLKSVPLRAEFSKYGLKTVELRGEAVIAKDKFVEINKGRESEGSALLANPRNAATGGLRTKNPNETRDRNIEVFIFQMGFAVDKDGSDMMPKLKSHFETIDLLGSLGFKIPTIEKTIVTNMKEAITFISEWEANREEYNYEIDGMVLKVDSFDLQNRCGSTSHHPRWAIAFKFKAKQATTKLINVEYQVGKIGSITPVAKLQPVSLAGVTISSVSLHNEEFIKARDLHIGDTVLVERAGDVIPYIVKAIEGERNGSEQVINFPTHCPINGTEDAPLLEKIEGEAAWRCTNCTCGAQELQKMIFHVSKEAMDIDGFGSSYVERFYELGWLKDLSDIYNLDYDKIAELEGFGKKSADNLTKAIEKAKNNPISRLLHSLTIHQLGKRASKIIAEQIDHVLDLCEWSREKYLALKDIGPVVAENMVAFFSKQENVDLLKRMESLGVNLKQTEEDKPKVLNESGVLFGKTILFTGTLTSMGRKEAEQKAEALGAKNISAVSKNLDILVVGESAGSKLTKAQAIPTITIYTEAEFVDLMSKL